MRTDRTPDRVARGCGIAVCIVVVAGCARVNPSQRRHLAHEVMDLDADGREVAMEEHVLQYREASVGGRGGGGSGCGCN